jgi:hypothetical protein
MLRLCSDTDGGKTAVLEETNSQCPVPLCPPQMLHGLGLKHGLHSDTPLHDHISLLHTQCGAMKSSS